MPDQPASPTRKARPITLNEMMRAVYSRQLFFVCGAPKSGTTWLQRLLDAHPQVRCMGEGHFAERLIEPLDTVFKNYNKHLDLVATRVYEGSPYYSGLNDGHLAMTVQMLVGALLIQQGTKPGLRCIGDKTPRYNLGLDTLLRFFPRAKFVHIVRDGRDVVASALHHALRAGYNEVLTQESEQHVKQIRQSARIWSQNVVAWRTFAAAHPAQCHQVSYEQLQQSPEKALAGVFAFLGADADEANLKTSIDAASFKKLSGREAGQEDKGSFFRKGVVGDWQNHFNGQDLALFMREAGGLMRELGYAPADGVSRPAAAAAKPAAGAAKPSSGAAKPSGKPPAGRRGPPRG